MSLASGEDIAVIPADFELVLQNRQIFEDSHRVAEQGSPLFRSLHPALEKSLSGMAEGEGCYRLITDGIKVYEIASTIEDPVPSPSALPATLAIARASQHASLLSADELLEKGNQSLEELKVEAPRLADFGAEVLNRYADSRYLLSFGMVGVALARLYDMSCAVEAATIEIRAL